MSWRIIKPILLAKAECHKANRGKIQPVVRSVRPPYAKAPSQDVPINSTYFSRLRKNNGQPKLTKMKVTAMAIDFGSRSQTGAAK